MICKGCGIRFKLINPTKKFHDEKCCRKYYNRTSNRRQQPNIKSVFKEKSKKIRCLSCDKFFLSEGKWNRICLICKNNSAFSTGSILYVRA